MPADAPARARRWAQRGYRLVREQGWSWMESVEALIGCNTSDAV
jgi:hypothetical protein